MTILLPIRMALSILEVCFSVVSSTKAARRLPSSARERSRILLTVISAVSADEKNADSNNKITRIINGSITRVQLCCSLLLLKMFPLLIYRYLLLYIILPDFASNGEGGMCECTLYFAGRLLYDGERKNKNRNGDEHRVYKQLW